MRDARSDRPSYGSIEKRVVCRRHWCSGPLVVAGSEIAQRMALAAGIEGWVGAYSDSNFGFVGNDGHRSPPKWPVGR